MTNIYVNTNKNLIKNGGREATKYSIDFLKQKIKDVMGKINYTAQEIQDMINNNEIRVDDIQCHSPKMQKDLSKIYFDFENNTMIPGEYQDNGGLLLGYHTLDNGLTFLGYLSGGDWESPIFLIIYYDGKSLRAYIPTCGNVFNRDTKNAFGNDDDNSFCQSELGEAYINEDTVWDITYNWELIEEDIKSRIITE